MEDLSKKDFYVVAQNGEDLYEFKGSTEIHIRIDGKSSFMIVPARVLAEILMDGIEKLSKSSTIKAPIEYYGITKPTQEKRWRVPDFKPKK